MFHNGCSYFTYFYLLRCQYLVQQISYLEIEIHPGIFDNVAFFFRLLETVNFDS